MIFGGYESFKFENSLIGAVYPTSPQDFQEDNDEAGPQSERKAKQEMMRTVAERGRYWYTYQEYMFVWLLKTCCCCFCSANSSWYKRRLEKYERHEQASEKLQHEIDIINLLYVQRIGKFIAKLILKKHQRALVTSFKKYQVDNLSQSDANHESDEMTQKSLLQPTV